MFVPSLSSQNHRFYMKVATRKTRVSYLEEEHGRVFDIDRQLVVRVDPVARRIVDCRLALELRRNECEARPADG